MTRQEIGAFACRILAVLAFIQALSLLQVSVPSAMSYLLVSTPGTDTTGKLLVPLIAVLTVLIFICLGVLLLVFAEPWGAYLVGKGRRDATDSGTAPVRVAITAGEIQAVGFAIVGLCVLALAIPRLVQAIGQFLLNQQLQGSYPPYVARMNMVQLAAPLVQFLIGLCLFLGARGLSGLWQSLRRNSIKLWQSYGFEPDDGEDGSD